LVVPCHAVPFPLGTEPPPPRGPFPSRTEPRPPRGPFPSRSVYDAVDASLGDDRSIIPPHAAWKAVGTVESGASSTARSGSSQSWQTIQIDPGSATDLSRRCRLPHSSQVMVIRICRPSLAETGRLASSGVDAQERAMRLDKKRSDWVQRCKGAAANRKKPQDPPASVEFSSRFCELGGGATLRRPRRHGERRQRSTRSLFVDTQSATPAGVTRIGR
jgi:hypothetical protein